MKIVGPNDASLPTPCTTIGPELAPKGTTARSWVFETTTTLNADVPAKSTPLAPLKFVPLMVTTVPGPPLVGKKPRMRVTGSYVNGRLVPTARPSCTVIAPSPAPKGTCA